MATKTKITLKIDTHLLREAKVLAAREDTSLSALLSELLEERVKKDLDYERAKEQALEHMREGLDLGGRPRSRDDIHER